MLCQFSNKSSAAKEYHKKPMMHIDGKCHWLYHSGITRNISWCKPGHKEYQDIYKLEPFPTDWI